MRFALGGTTSINGSGSVDGFLRNLDRSNALEGLNADAVEYETFPWETPADAARRSAIIRCPTLLNLLANRLLPPRFGRHRH